MNATRLFVALLAAATSLAGCGLNQPGDAPPAPGEVEVVQKGYFAFCSDCGTGPHSCKSCVCGADGTDAPGDGWKQSCLNDITGQCPPGSGPGCDGTICDCNKGLVAKPATCAGACDSYVQGRVCQCDSACAQYGDCCSDYKVLCTLSCSGRCGTYDSRSRCQCDDQCALYGDCCADHASLCTPKLPCSCDGSCALLGNCCLLCP